MKRSGSLVFLLVFAAIVPTAPAQGRDEKAAVTQALNDYISAFGSFDAQRVLPYYHEPLTLVTAPRVVGMTGRADIEVSMLKPLYARLKERGWDVRSEWAQLSFK
jgi:hypothetical protein